MAVGQFNLTDGTVSVWFSTAVAYFIVSPLLCVVILVINCYMLLAIWLKPGLHSMTYAPHLVLIITNTVLSLIFLPVKLVITYSNWNGTPFPSYLCYVSESILFFYLVSSILLTVFLGELHLKRISAHDANNLTSTVLRWIVVSLVLALLIAAGVGIEHRTNLFFTVCKNGRASLPESPIDSFSVLQIVVCILFVLINLIVIGKQYAAVWGYKKRLAHSQNCNDIQMAHHNGDMGQPNNLQLSPNRDDDLGALQRGEEPSKHSTSVTFKEEEEVIPDKAAEQNQRTKVQKHTGKGKKKKLNFPFRRKEDDFDEKMRGKMQKKSNRRHTVANIGDVGDELQQRRGSLEAAAPKPEYDYMRKWSVDIEALQQQLANPRLFGGSLPVHSLGVLHETDLSEPEDEDDDDPSQTSLSKSASEVTSVKPDESNLAAYSCQKASTSTSTDNSTSREAHSSAEGPSLAVDNNSSAEVPSIVVDNHSPAEAHSLVVENNSSAEVPSIVVDNNFEDTNDVRTPLTHETQAENCVGASTSHVSAECNSQRNYPGEELNQQLHELIHKTQSIIYFYLVNLLCITPYMAIQFSQPWLESNLAFNLLQISALCPFVLAALHPFLLILMSLRIRGASAYLWSVMRKAGCVCIWHRPGPIQRPDQLRQDTRGSKSDFKKTSLYNNSIYF